MTSRLVSGIDIVEIQRIQQAVERWGYRFLTRVYTVDEISHCRGRVSSLAGRFAAKEAASKALGVGVHALGWREIEVLGGPQGKPTLTLHGRAEQRARELGIEDMDISISHSRDNAIAVAVAWRTDR